MFNNMVVMCRITPHANQNFLLSQPAGHFISKNETNRKVVTNSVFQAG